MCYYMSSLYSNHECFEPEYRGYLMYTLKLNKIIKEKYKKYHDAWCGLYFHDSGFLSLRLCQICSSNTVTSHDSQYTEKALRPELCKGRRRFHIFSTFLPQWNQVWSIVKQNKKSVWNKISEESFTCSSRNILSTRHGLHRYQSSSPASPQIHRITSWIPACFWTLLYQHLPSLPRVVMFSLNWPFCGDRFRVAVSPYSSAMIFVMYSVQSQL